MRMLFPEHGRYTKKKVRAFYIPQENRVHLVYPHSLGNPFLHGNKFIEESIDKFRFETGLGVTWTPVGGITTDDSSDYAQYEEVLL